MLDMILDVMGWGIKECMLFADHIVMCSTRREHVERKLQEWRRAMDERGFEISRKNTEYLGCNEHQYAVFHLQGETVKTVKTFTYMGSTLADYGELEESVCSVVR